ncbi:hypothetical protein LSCM1_05190 [Leishmania martiniquensis]|uniref:Dynein regulatory complex protein 12 n=1 Tax=Leishmania martiniquensis TaxID=1580590 RepID=A0A836HAH0_9TRYP|nr:hypothetical protein LSCM1_05190 [Leishmania martiniquensis]
MPGNMPAKVKKGATTAPNDLFYEDQQLADGIAIMEERLKALKREYLERMTALAIRKEQQLSFSAELEARKEVLEAKKNEKIDVLTDCTRAYKVRERKAVEEIAKQDAALNALQETKKKLQDNLDTFGVELDSQIKSKRRVFECLRERIAEMEKEFAVLLSDVEQCAP